MTRTNHHLVAEGFDQAIGQLDLSPEATDAILDHALDIAASTVGWQFDSLLGRAPEIITSSRLCMACGDLYLTPSPALTAPEAAAMVSVARATIYGFVAGLNFRVSI